ncbi:MAG: hypothetical protein R3E48_16755 [Burkholderiaceae bacterium]
MSIIAVNDAPALAGIEATPLAVTENNPATAVTATLAVSDVDSPNLASATVSILANYVNGEDVHQVFADTASITGSWNAGTGVLTLSGADTLAAYQAAIRSVTYQNTSDNPSTVIRTLSISVNDGALASNTVTRDITVAALNDAPVLDNSGNMTLTTITEDQTNNSGDTVASIIASASGDRITDVDTGAIEGIAITNVNWGTDNSWFEYSTDGGSTWTLLHSQADDRALLLRSTDLIRFEPRGYGVETASIEFRAWDQTSGSAGDEVDTTSNGGSTAFSTAKETATITTTAVNDAPTFGVQPGASIEHLADGGQSSVANDVVVLADGSSITAGYGRYNGADAWVIAKFRPDGGLDSSFGTNGSVILEFGAGSDRADAILEQPDGKLVVGGYTYNGSNRDFTLIRLNSDGSADTGFGAAGRIDIDLGGNEYEVGVAIDSTGDLYVTGNTSTGNLIVARINGTDGSLDAGYGTAGIANIDLGAFDNAFAIAIDASDRVVATGRTTPNAFVARLTTSGSLDTTFDTDGWTTTAMEGQGAYGFSILVQADGNIVITGLSYDYSAPAGQQELFGIARFTDTGALDTGFAGDGVVRTAVPDAANWFNGAYDVAQQADGKLVVVGYVDMGSFDSDWGVFRYNTDGSLDASFDGDGILVPQTGRYWNQAYAVDIASDGTIVVAGSASYTSYEVTTVVHINPDGSTDTTAASGVVDDSPTFVEGSSPVILDSDVTVFDRELTDADNFDGASLTLVRNGGASADDQFSATGLLGALTEGGNLVYDSVTIGTVTTNSAGLLELNFNASADNDAVNETLRSIAYSNSSDSPPASVQIDWTFDDGNTGAQGSGGALQATGSTLVTITAVNDAPVLAAIEAAPWRSPRTTPPPRSPPPWLFPMSTRPTCTGHDLRLGKLRQRRGRPGLRGHGQHRG